jgi:glycosyltransferase involved in cell wall biosynthesis
VKGVKYIGPVFDQSGYAEAARNYVLALHSSGVPITVDAVRHSEGQPDLGSEGEVLVSLVDRPIDYDRVVIHATPDTWAHRLRDEPSGLPIVGCTVWETSALHPIWAAACNRVDEVWVPSRWNAEVFRASGVRTPVTVVPHCIGPADSETPPPLAIDGIGADTFVFYSIFHWNERKNPEGLLAAYLAAMSGIRNVALVLKTHFERPRWVHVGRPDARAGADRVEPARDAAAHDPAREARVAAREPTDEERAQLEIAAFKRKMNLPHYPRIVTLTGTLDRARLQALHRRGDAFVLLQRAEGWGLPHFEAAAMGKPVVTTGYGGPSEFLEPDGAYLVGHTLRPVWGMEWSFFYGGSQRWAEPDLDQAVDLMRRVYADRREAAARGARARDHIARHFTRAVVGPLMADRLEGLRPAAAANVSSPGVPGSARR